MRCLNWPDRLPVIQSAQTDPQSMRPLFAIAPLALLMAYFAPQRVISQPAPMAASAPRATPTEPSPGNLLQALLQPGRLIRTETPSARQP